MDDLKRYVYCWILINDMVMRRLVVIFLGAIIMASCAPSARFFNVDVRDHDALNLRLEKRPVAVLSVYGNVHGVVNKMDSINVSTTAIALAERLEENYSINRGDVNVYSVFSRDLKEDVFISHGYGTSKKAMGREDHIVDTTYIQSLMLKTGAHVFVSVSDVGLCDYSVKQNSVMGEYDNATVAVPYLAGMRVFDAIKNKYLYSRYWISDTIYMKVPMSVVKEDKVGSTILVNQTDIFQKIGGQLAARISPKWVTQERMLITFEGESAWNAPYLMAEDFRWKEAVEAWMELAKSENPKRAAYAAFNIAVGCEMMEQFDLAVKWIEFSIKKYRFPEAVDLRDHLLELQKEAVGE